MPLIDPGDHAIRTVAIAHQRDLLEQLPVRQLADEALAEIGQMLRDIVAWLAEHRLSQIPNQKEAA